MYYSAIGLLAVIILLIENQDILLNLSDAFDKPAWKAYRRFLLSVLIYYFTDIIWGVLEDKKMTKLLFADTTVNFIAMAAGLLLWTHYVVVYLNEDNSFSRFLLNAGIVLASSVTILAIINIFYPLLFSVDEACVYHAHGLRYVMLAAQILLLILISVHAFLSFLKKSKSVNKIKKYRTLVFFGMIMAVCLFAQLWFPYLPLYAIAYMLTTCMLRAFVIGDEKEAFRTELKETEKIKELKQSISSLLNNMPGMSFSKDVKTGAYIACNQAFAEYAQKESPEGVTGLTDADIFDPVTAARFAEDDRMALSMEEPYIFFEDVMDAAGNQRQLQTIKLKFIDDEGRQCLLGMCQDVTELVSIRRENAMTKDAYEKAKNTGIIYNRIAHTLASGYMNLFYINEASGKFTEYRTDEKSGRLIELRSGDDFFNECRTWAKENVYPYDREAFVKAMEKQTLLDYLERNGTFIITQRLITDEKPVYVSVKVSRIEDDERYILMGIMNVDEQMKHRRLAERMAEERIAYMRLSTLTGNIICIYIVEPESGHYREYSSSSGFQYLGFAKEGKDFFTATRKLAHDYIYAEDLPRFMSLVSKENVLSEVEVNGLFSLSYRMILNEKPTYVQLKISNLDEKEGRRLIVGINDIDASVRREEDYERRLVQAQSRVNIDALTGVKNKHAYLDAEKLLNSQITKHRNPQFAILIMDVNNLKKTNDTEGHQAGDQYIRNACRVICDIFNHSPVFRIGGDEFAVITQEEDYLHVEELVEKMASHNREAVKSGGIVIACGMSKYNEDTSVAAVFERADHNMYENKSRLKDINTQD